MNSEEEAKHNPGKWLESYGPILQSKILMLARNLWLNTRAKAKDKEIVSRYMLILFRSIDK
jgi:hypothetical protein